MRRKWARLFGFLAVSVLALGAVVTVMTLLGVSGDEDVLLETALWDLAFIVVPACVVALLFGGMAYILSDTSVKAGRVPGYFVLVAVGALCAPIGLWLLGMALLLTLGIGAYYVLWRDIRKHRRTQA
jgi:hypothetical protein